jgi:hypothetical protein
MKELKEKDSEKWNSLSEPKNYFEEHPKETHKSWGKFTRLILISKENTH